MAMQGDVKSVHLNTTGSAVSYRTRVKGISVCASASVVGTLVLKDGGSGGTILLEIDIPSNSNPNSFYLAIPQEGILFQTSVYATLTNMASVTIFYG